MGERKQDRAEGNLGSQPTILGLKDSANYKRNSGLQSWGEGLGLLFPPLVIRCHERGEGTTLKSNEWNHGQSLSQRSEIHKSGESTGYIHWCCSLHFTQGRPLSTLGTNSEQRAWRASEEQNGIPWLWCPSSFLPGRESNHQSQEDSSRICHRKYFLLRLHLNCFLNKHEQVQEVLSMKFWRFPVMRGLDKIQPLHKQIQQEAGWSQRENPGRILWRRNQRKMKWDPAHC